MQRLLVAEDDPGTRVSLTTVLRREGFVVDEVDDGIEAARRGSQHPYELVILDIGLPGIDGLEVCRRIRAAHAAVSILLLTARGDEGDVVAGLNAGADDYVVKPFSPAVLLARVRALLRRTIGDTLSAGGVHVDRAARQAFRDGVELSLTQREFDLLATLVENPGKTVSREALTAALWGEWYGSPKTLDMHVVALRRKLGEPSLITTVRGVGLRLDV